MLYLIREHSDWSILSMPGTQGEVVTVHDNLQEVVYHGSNVPIDLLSDRDKISIQKISTPPQSCSSSSIKRIIHPYFIILLL